MILILLTKCISFENYKFSYWYFRVVSFSLKKIKINTSLCHCLYSILLKYPIQIGYSAFVLQRMYSRYVEYMRVLFYFICYLFLHIYLNANIGSFMEEWWPHKIYFYMHLLILKKCFFCFLFFLRGCKSDLQKCAGSDKYAELSKLH